MCHFFRLSFAISILATASSIRYRKKESGPVPVDVPTRHVFPQPGLHRACLVLLKPYLFAPQHDVGNFAYTLHARSF